MSFSTVVRSRLTALGYAQKDLARATRVAESYISQLLTRKKAPPAPDRTDIYPRMEAFLKLERGDLARLARIQRRLFVDARRTFELDEPIEEPGLAEFLDDSRLCGDVTEEELELLRRCRFDGRRPTKLYYYRALQNLRDPMHFGER